MQTIKIDKCKVWRHALSDHGTTNLFDNRNDFIDIIFSQTLILLTTEAAHTKLSCRNIAILETSPLHISSHISKRWPMTTG